MENHTVKSADRVLDVFELLSKWKHGLAHTDIANTLDIPKSSLTQLLKNLIERRYVAWISEEKIYRLGPKLSELAKQLSQSVDLVELSRAVLEEITRKTGESSALNLLHGDVSQVALSVSGSQRLMTYMLAGDAAPLYATSGGKAILAYQPETMIDAYLATVRFEAVTPRTVSSVQQLRDEIAKVRLNRYAEVHEEFTPGVVGFSVPVLSSAKLALGALNVAMPATRFNRDSKKACLDALWEGARVLERRLANARD